MKITEKLFNMLTPETAEPLLAALLDEGQQDSGRDVRVDPNGDVCFKVIVYFEADDDFPIFLLYEAGTRKTFCLIAPEGEGADYGAELVLKQSGPLWASFQTFCQRGEHEKGANWNCEDDIDWELPRRFVVGNRVRITEGPSLWKGCVGVVTDHDVLRDEFRIEVEAPSKFSYIWAGRLNMALAEESNGPPPTEPGQDPLAPGDDVYVDGQVGGRITAVTERLLDEIDPTQGTETVYEVAFADPNRQPDDFRECDLQRIPK